MRVRCIIHRNKFLFLTLVGSIVWSVSVHGNGQSSELQMRLHRQISITWSGQSLNHALASLSDHEELNVWLDRRVDPEQKIDLVLQRITYKEALTELAQSCGLKVAYVGSLVYLGPADAAEEIMALREKLHARLKKGKKKLRKVWLQESVWTWPRLSEPRKLLQKLFSGTPIKLQGVDQIPYDLWKARQLPRMTRIDRATLLLIGFDLTLQPELNRTDCQVVPIEHPVLLTRRYPISASQMPAVARLQRNYPDLNIELMGSKLRPSVLQVTGTWNAQQNFRQAIAGQAPGGRMQERHPQGSEGRAGDQQVYSLEIREQTLQKVLKQLASQLSVELTWDEQQLASAGYSLDVRISCKVQSASLEQLLEAILNPVSLQFQRVGKQIRIVPAP